MYDNYKMNPIPRELFCFGYDADLISIRDTNLMLYYQELSLMYMRRRYANFDVKVQPLIQSFLLASGDLKHQIFENTDSFNFRLSVNKLLKDNVENNTDQLINSTLKADKPNGSRRKQLKHFFDNCSRCGKYNKCNKLPFEITTDTYKNLPRKRISYADTVSMLLFFIYQDGRKDNDDKKGPRRSTKVTKCSTESYKKVLRQILSFFPENPFDKGWFLNINQLYQTEKIFKFFRTAQLEEKKKDFLSDDNLQLICDSFKLPYRKIISLEDTLNNMIFENKKFIEYCIKTNYPDAFQLFAYFFKKYMILNHVIKNSESDNHPDNHKTSVENRDLEYHIIFCQRETRKYINRLLSYLNQLLKEDIEKVNFYFIANIYLELNPYLNEEKPYENMFKKYYINTRNILEDYINIYTSQTSEYTKNLFETARSFVPNFYN